MKMKKLGSTLNFKDRITDGEEKKEIAFAIAKSMIPGIIEYQNRIENNKIGIQEKSELLEDTIKEIDRTVNLIKQTEGEIEKIKKEIEKIEFRLLEIDSKPWRYFRWLWMLFNGKKWHFERDPVQAELDKNKEQLSNTNDSYENYRQQEQNLLDDKEELKQMLSELRDQQEGLKTVPQIVHGIGSFAYPIIPIIAQEYEKSKKNKGLHPQVVMMIDPNGDSQKIVLPDLAVNETDIDKALDIINGFNSNSIMLSARQKANKYGKLGDLYGFEEDLKEAIQILNSIAKNFEPREFELPIIMKSSSLGKYIEKFKEKISELSIENTQLDSETLSLIEEKTQIAEEIQKLLSKKNAGKIRQADELIITTENDLKRKYEDALLNREISVSINSEFIKNSQINSLLVRYHYYCPKCNLSPVYYNELFGINLNEIGNFDILSHEDLVVKFRTFQENIFNDASGAKMDISLKNEIKDSWEEAFEKMRVYEANCFEYHEISSEKNVFERKLANVNKRQVKFSIYRYRELALELIKSPRRIWELTLNDDETQETDYSALKSPDFQEAFNPNTRLFYDPDLMEWQCPLCENKFNLNEAKMGAINKIKYDVETPVLNTLWMDNNIWDKTLDLLNDTAKEIRNTRKSETNAITSPIDNFLADCRQIRGTIQEAYSQGRAATVRLREMAEEFLKQEIFSFEEYEKIIETANTAENKFEYIDKKLMILDEQENNIQDRKQIVNIQRSDPSLPTQELISGEKLNKLFAVKLLD
ncbi:MAG: hypothetical protein JW870_11130 [Candidatus Delongbacteria bacterium]|nr:hypothetical protein [Candidatus Delongbacteria bacterium]